MDMTVNLLFRGFDKPTSIYHTECNRFLRSPNNQYLFMAVEKEKTDNDPTIEEILDSIRQIIADDEGDEADFSEESVVEPEPEPEPEEEEILSPEPEESDLEPEPEEEVLELTDKIIEIPEPAPEPLPVEESIEIDLRDIEEEPPEEEIHEPEPVPLPPPSRSQSPPSNEDSLLSEATEEAAFDAIAKLARKTAVVANGITLEEIVRQELRPLLREWLDRNLQGIVERLVRDELERVTNRVMDE